MATEAKASRHAMPTVLMVVTEDWYFISHRLDLACHIRDAGFRVVVATRVGAHEPTIIAAGLEFVRIPFERSLRHPARDLQALVALNSAIAQLEPDIVHLVSLKPILLGAIALARRRHRAPAVWAFTGMGYLFSSNGFVARVMRPLVSGALKHLNQGSRCAMMVQNDADAALLHELGIALPAHTTIVPGSGLAMDKFAPASGAPEGPPIVLMPARLLRDKGIYEFAAAARLVHQQYPLVRFVLAGRFDRDNHGAVANRDLQTWVDEDLLEWWGHREDMLEVYRLASMVCLPSYREGLPRVLLEAGACAKPLVATDVPGCRDVCVDGKTGLSVPVCDSAALATAISTLLSDPAYAHALGLAARELVRERFTIESIGEQTIAVYRDLLVRASQSDGPSR